jgi:GNAT superfamily N-acetyltransferase
VLLHHTKPRYKHPALELVAELNGEIVGIIDVEAEPAPGELGYARDSRCGFVWEFGVRPDRRGEGIARRLVEAAQEWLDKRGIKRMEFWSMDETAQHV